MTERAHPHTLSLAVPFGSFPPSLVHTKDVQLDLFIDEGDMSKVVVVFERNAQ